MHLDLVKFSTSGKKAASGIEQALIGTLDYRGSLGQSQLMTLYAKGEEIAKMWSEKFVEALRRRHETGVPKVSIVLSPKASVLRISIMQVLDTSLVDNFTTNISCSAEFRT